MYIHVGVTINYYRRNLNFLEFHTLGNMQDILGLVKSTRQNINFGVPIYIYMYMYYTRSTCTRISL